MICQFQNNYKNFFSIVPNDDKEYLFEEKSEAALLGFD